MVDALAAKPLERFHKNVLHDVFGVCPMADDPPHRAIHGAPMTIDDSVKVGEQRRFARLLVLLCLPL